MVPRLALLLTLVACGGGEPAPQQPATPPAPPAPPAEQPAQTEAPAAEAPAAAGEADFASLSDEEKLAKLMELGENVYKTKGTPCITCHQADGKGLPPAFPPLAGSKTEMGDCVTHAGYVVHGVKGEITVQGVKYNGVMPPQADLSDLEIAAVITYERNSWGNDYGLCLPEHVAQARTAPPPAVPGQ